MRIGLDLDGVCADFTGHWPRVYEQWFGKSVPDDIVNSWDGIEHVFGDADKFWHWVDRVPNFWRDMPAVPGAAGAVYQLAMDGHVLEFITNRHEKAAIQTDQWLKRAMPDFGRLWKVHFVKGDKSIVDMQLYVEDNPRRIKELRKKQRRVVRFVQPWNVDDFFDFDQNPSVIDDGMCAGDWSQVLEIIDLLASFGEVPGQRKVTEETTTVSV